MNLSRGNRLLYLKPGSVLEIVEPGIDEVYDRLDAGLDVPESRDPELFADEPTRPLRAGQIRFGPIARSTTQAKLRNLDRTASQTFLDRGIWTLYLGFGLLEWEDAPRTTGAAEKVYSPLLLVPVTAKRDSPREPFRIKRTEEEQRFNPALLTKLEDDFGITLQLPSDDDELDPRQILQSVSRQVSRMGWQAYPRTVLSTFTFHKEPILRDLITNEELVLSNEAVKGLAIGSEAAVSFEFEPVDESEIDPAAPPEKAVTILDADASQRRAIAAAVAGKSFVMDGPPGTGKSQTIANMIADLLSQRRTVLFVSDKAAALDVVHARLQAAGLSEFVLELHSHKATRKEVAKELGRSLLTRVKPELRMPDADRERLRRKREQLNDYVAALNEGRLPLGQSLHRVIGRISRLQALPQAPPPSLGVQDLDHARWVQITELADALSRAWGPITRGNEFHWRELIPSEWDSAMRVRLLATLESAATNLSELQKFAASAASNMRLRPSTTTLEVEQHHAVENVLMERAYVHEPWLSGSNDRELRDRLEAARRVAACLSRAEACLDREVGQRWHELRTEGPESLLTLVVAARATMPQPTIDGAATSVTLEALRQSLVQATAVLEECSRHIDVLASAFDQHATMISFDRALELGRLSGLAELADLPEADWFTPVGVRKAREAIERLRPLLARVRTVGQSLNAVFKREVLDLDLETLCVRFESTYRSVFRWFSSDYRRDRRALKMVTRSGRVRREELARLRETLEWQAAVRAFETAAAESRKTLGHYLRGEGTDLDAAERGVGTAEEACRLAGTTIGPEVLAKRLAWDADFGPGAAQAAVRILGLQPQFESLGTIAAQLRTQPLSTAIDGARQADGAVLRVIEQLRVVDALAARPARLEDVERWLRLRHEVEEAERSFRDAAVADAAAFGSAWNGQATEWDRVAAGLSWAAAIKTALDGAVSPECANRLATMPVLGAMLGPPLGRWAASIGVIAGQFTEQRAEEVRQQLRGSFNEGEALIHALTKTIDDIGEWHAHVRAIAGLTQQGLGEASQFCLTKRLAAEQVCQVLERALCEAWADDVLKHDPRMATFRADDRDALVQDFRRLDRELVRLSACDAIAACTQMRSLNLQGAAGIILNEANKQRKHMPVRDLLGKTREVAQAIKPCFMMSPLSVSQFLPPDIVFDIVIFDEASQVRPADAISSIYRGKQLVVAGDQKQLPPTSFFERMDDGDDDTYVEDEPDQFESVLDKCKGSGIFTSLPLRWHYRSQHEHLIAYSNYGFYDGKLITFPGAPGEAPDLGVEVFECAGGIYRRGGQRDNPQEAALVGERVIFHAREHPSLSIGVVAFSDAQASLIDAVIERLADQHRELAALRSEDRLHGLFVKNLETVQGDERDIIIFSMGYGKDEAGKFTMNFGPLSKPGGERRLNVAITRARRKVEFVTSVRASDFSLELTAEGARHLKHYLEYAERPNDRMAVLAIPLKESLGDIESPFEAEVASTIRAWGYDVVPQVGCSEYRIDLGIRRPGGSGFVLGVECDGAMYHSSRAARDRDRLRQEVLQRLGWRLHRIWGPSWYRHRSEQERRLRSAIEEALWGGPIGPAPGSETSYEQPRTQMVDLDSRPAWATAYKVAKLPSPGAHPITDLRAREALKRLIALVIAEEGPIHRNRLLRRAKSAFEVERAGARIQEAFDDALAEVKSAQRLIRDREGFLWLEGLELRVRIPTDGDPLTRRFVEEVAPWELQCAIARTVNDALRIEREAAMTYVARLYGWDRNGGRIESAFNAAIKALMRSKQIRADEEWLTPAPTEGDA